MARRASLSVGEGRRAAIGVNFRLRGLSLGRRLCRGHVMGQGAMAFMTLGSGRICRVGWYMNVRLQGRP